MNKKMDRGIKKVKKMKFLKLSFYKLYCSCVKFPVTCSVFSQKTELPQKACPRKGKGRESLSKVCPREDEDHLQPSNRTGIFLRKNTCHNFYGKCFFVLLTFFSLSALSNHEEHCEWIRPWELPVCGQTIEEITYKESVLSHALGASITRTREIPEEVIEASRAVFNIGFQNTFREWSWNFLGSSGFFMFDQRTFFSAYNLLESLEENVSHWNEVVFKDQDGVQQNFKIKGVKFASKLRDIVVFEVEGYEGPVLDLSLESPQGQSYIIGYPEGFKIKSVTHPFEAADTRYGAFIELFDCYYDLDFKGADGGPFLNKEGKVEGVFVSKINTSLPKDCGFILAGKLDFFNEGVKNKNQTYRSLAEVRELMRKEEQKIIALSADGNKDATFTLLTNRGFSFEQSDPLAQMRDLITSGNTLIRHTLSFVLIKMRQQDAISDAVSEVLIPETDALMSLMNDEESFRNRFIATINDLISGFEPQELLSMTWYEMGLAAYHIDDNLTEACDFWNKARQTGHPLVLADSVIIPNVDIIRCKF